MNETSESTLAPIPLRSMVTFLCIVSGSLDAISFLVLGEAFASVMTGNIVFMGVAAGTFNSQLAVSCGVAIGGYMAGVLMGSWAVHKWKRASEEAIWPFRVTKTLGIQFVLLILIGVGWFCVGGRPVEQLQAAFLLFAACVMGIQSAAIRSIGISVSTTYMTGALTTLLEALVTGRPFSHTESSAVSGLLALAVGALLGSLLVVYGRPIAFLIPIVGVGAVILISTFNRRIRVVERVSDGLCKGCRLLMKGRH